MKLSASLTIALLSNQNVAAASSPGGGLASSAIGMHTLQRMLASKEDNGHLLARELQKGQNKGGGGGGGGGGKKKGGGGGVVTGGTKKGSRGYDSVGPPGRGKKKHANAAHSAFMDENDSGVKTDDVTYEYGTPIEVEFELTNELVPLEELKKLDLSKMDEWTLGIFMRMADPQGGSQAPIVSITPAIAEARRLQGDTQPTQPAVTDDAETTTEPTMIDEIDDDDQEPPTLNHVGSGTFSASDTEASVLVENQYGMGFDVYLLDEDGAAIIGPATFYMLPTEEMKEAAAAAEAEGPKFAKFSHGRKKGKKPKGSGGNLKGGGKGKGPSTKPVLGGSAALPEESYDLKTKEIEYELGAEITVVYDLGAPASDSRRRRLPRAERNGGGGNNGGGNGGGGQPGNGPEPEAPPSPTPPTTEAPPSTSPPGADETTTAATDPPLEGGGAYPDEGETIGEEFEAQLDVEEFDEMDRTLYKMGVFMRMAHPQGGKLLPIHEQAFCADPEDCDVAAVSSGTFAFTTDVLDVDENGYGFDVWILNGEGGGMAGPHTFYVINPDDE